MRDQGQRRPWIISVLAILWLTGLALSPMMAWRMYTRTGGADAFSVTFALVSGLMTYGLWRGKRWARMCQILLLVPALALLPLIGAAIITIGYLNRPKTRAYFAPTPGAATWDGGTFLQSEWPWILSILLTLGGGWILLLSLAPLYRQWG